MKENLLEQLRFCTNLPSLPSIVLKIIDLAGNADTSLTQINHYISLDPALAAKISKPPTLHCINPGIQSATSVRRPVFWEHTV